VGDRTTANLKELGLVAFDPSHHEHIDVRGDLMIVTRDQLGGLEVVDVSDPAKPRWIASFEEMEPPSLELKWMPDGKGAVVGNMDSVVVVDLSDPANPRLASTWKYPTPGMNANVHTLATKRIAEEDWLFIATNDDKGVHVLRFEGAPANRTVEYVTSFAPFPLTGGPLGPHDMSVIDDEITGKPILYVANGFEGWLAADVSDPARPKALGGLVNADPGQGYTHTVRAQKIGERRIVVTDAEVGVNAVKVFDATDLSRPLLLAEWRADATRPNLPEHLIQLLDGRLYLAHFEKGLYVFDLRPLGSTPLLETTKLAPVARYVPPDPRETHSQEEQLLGFQNVWDVSVNRGVIFANDVARGVVSLGYGCLAPGDAKATASL
jgi:hypothetical protein